MCEPKKCGTPRCDHPPAEPILVHTVKAGAIELHDGPRPTWRWACECGWAESRLAPRRLSEPAS